MMSYPFLSQSSEELSIICKTTQLAEELGPPGPAPLKDHAHFQVVPTFSLNAWSLNCAESAPNECGRDSVENQWQKLSEKVLPGAPKQGVHGKDI